MKRSGTMLAGAVALMGATATGALAAVDADEAFGAVVPGSSIRIAISSLLSSDPLRGGPPEARFRGTFLTKGSEVIGSVKVREDGVIVVRFRENTTGMTRFKYVIEGVRTGWSLSQLSRRGAGATSAGST